MKTYSLKTSFNKYHRKLYFAGINLCTAIVVTACETPQSPVGRPTIKPSASASASPVDSDEPLCLQTLQCVIETTANNALRKETQEVINTLFKTAEPKYSQICQTKADELAETMPKCVKTAPSPTVSASPQVKPSPSTLPKPSPSIN